MANKDTETFNRQSDSMVKKSHGENNQTDQDEHTARPFLMLSGGIVFVWLLAVVFAYKVFPDWTTKGSVGDTFDAVNALFAGLALAGVICTLLLQRSDLKLQREELRLTRSVMESQLKEMQTARELQAQPLAIPAVSKFRVERPRFFYSPPEKEYSAHSRYYTYVQLRNPTQFPAVAVNASAAIVIQCEDRIEYMDSTDHFAECLAPESELSDKNAPSFMFAIDRKAIFFNALRQDDPRKVPAIRVSVLYKNIIGAAFVVRQLYQVYFSYEDVQIIQRWHTAIVGFEAKYKHQLTAMNKLQPHSSAEWRSLFDGVTNDFDESLGSKDKEVLLSVEPVPGSFEVLPVPAQKYKEVLENAAYGHRVTPGLYECPVDIDIRAKA